MSLADKSLNELAELVFSDRYQYHRDKQKLKGSSGKTWTFDALVSDKNNAKFGIFIKDWKREISVTQLRQLHKACLDIPEIEGGIMICNIISEFSKDYSSQFGLQLLSKGHLISKIRSRQYQF